MPPSGVDYASGFLNGYAPEYVKEIDYKKLPNSFVMENHYWVRMVG